jgi:hypothetical protein
VKRLSVARQRELWHAYREQISWRFTRDGTRYAWCRICGRDATRQTEKLIELGYLEPVDIMIPVSVRVNMEKTRPYLEKYLS